MFLRFNFKFSWCVLEKSKHYENSKQEGGDISLGINT